MRFTRGTVRIGLDDGARTDDAQLCGPFAIHQTRYQDWSKARGAWTVTHVPSGRCLLQDATSERAARRLCREVEPLADWSQMTPALPEPGSRGREALREALFSARGFMPVSMPA